MFLQFPIVICCPGKEPTTRKGKNIDQLGVEISVDPKDFRDVDRQAMPIVLISDGDKRYFPNKYLSTQTYTDYKLKVVANLVASCLSESNTIDTRVLHDHVKDQFMNLKSAIRGFLNVHPAESANPTRAGTKVVQRVQGTVVPSILQNAPSSEVPHQENSVPVPFTSQSLGSVKPKKKKEKKVHKCPHCDYTKTKTNDINDHVIAVHGEGFICNEGVHKQKIQPQKEFESSPEAVPVGVQISVY